MAENRGGLSPTTFMGRSQEDVTTMKVLVSNQASLDAVNVQLVRISTQMSEFSNSLTRISGLMAESSALERLKEQQQAKQERELAEQRLREGKESVVERKMQSALAAPIQKVGAKAQGTLGNLMRFFTILLSGWLLNQGIQALKAYSEGNKKRLQDIGKSVLKGLAITGAIFGSIKLGLAAVTGSLLRTGSLISQAVFSGLFKRPVQALINAVKGVFNKDKTPPKTPPKTKPSAVSKPSGVKLNFTSNMVIGGIMAGLDIAGGEEPGRAITGAGAGMVGSAAAFGLGSLIPLPGTGVAAGIAAYSPSANFGKETYDTAKSYLSQFNFNLDIGKSFNDMSNMIGMGGGKDKTQESHKADIVAKPLAKVSSPPKADTSAIGPEPESQTQVIVTDAGMNQQQQSIPTATGNIADLPPIASSNPDNFYVLYSQVHYNVVI
jgi:hypothetical protein